MNLIHRTYDVVRPYLPKKWGVINGVPVKDFRLFDRQDYQMDRMEGLLTAIEDCVDMGDTVVDIATGRGVCAVTAARQGASRVHTFEASDAMVETSRATIEASRHVSRIEQHHTLVGDENDVWGESTATVVDPSELPVSDVMILDVEGSELSILESINDYPECIIVETHPGFHAPTSVTKQLLEEMGYDVSVRDYEDRKPEKDVLVAQA